MPPGGSYTSASPDSMDRVAGGLADTAIDVRAARLNVLPYVPYAAHSLGQEADQLNELGNLISTVAYLLRSGGQLPPLNIFLSELNRRMDTIQPGWSTYHLVGVDSMGNHQPTGPTKNFGYEWSLQYVVDENGVEYWTWSEVPKEGTNLPPATALPAGLQWWAVDDGTGTAVYVAGPPYPTGAPPAGTHWVLQTNAGVGYWTFAYNAGSTPNYGPYQIPNVSSIIARLDAETNGKFSKVLDDVLNGRGDTSRLQVDALLAHYFYGSPYPAALMGQGGGVIEPGSVESLVDQFLEQNGYDNFDWRNGKDPNSESELNSAEFDPVWEGANTYSLNGIDYGVVGTMVNVGGKMRLVSASITQPTDSQWPATMPLYTDGFGKTIDVWFYKTPDQYGVWVAYNDPSVTAGWSEQKLGKDTYMGIKMTMQIGGTMANPIEGMYPIDAPRAPAPSSTVAQIKAYVGDYIGEELSYFAAPVVFLAHTVGQSADWAFGDGDTPTFSSVVDSSGRTLKTVHDVGAVVGSTVFGMVVPDLPTHIKDGDWGMVALDVVQVVSLLIPVVGATETGAAALARGGEVVAGLAETVSTYGSQILEYIKTSAGARWFSELGTVAKTNLMTALDYVRGGSTLAQNTVDFAEASRAIEAGSDMRQVWVLTDDGLEARWYDASGVGEVSTVSPSEVRFSQSTVTSIRNSTTPEGSLQAMIERFKAAGTYTEEPIDVIQMPDGSYTAYDNKRLLAANEAGVDVQIRVHPYNEPLNTKFLTERFPPGETDLPQTWGEAVTDRLDSQINVTYDDLGKPLIDPETGAYVTNTTWLDTYPYGSPFVQPTGKGFPGIGAK